MESETNTAEVSCLSIGCPGQCYGPLADELPSHLDAVRAIAFHPTELCLASGGDDLTLNIWNVMQGRLLYRILFEAAISCLVWHPLYPDTVIAACDDGRIFQLHDFMPVSSFPLLIQRIVSR